LGWVYGVLPKGKGFATGLLYDDKQCGNFMNVPKQVDVSSSRIVDLIPDIGQGLLLLLCGKPLFVVRITNIIEDRRQYTTVLTHGYCSIHFSLAIHLEICPPRLAVSAYSSLCSKDICLGTTRRAP